MIQTSRTVPPKSKREGAEDASLIRETKGDKRGLSGFRGVAVVERRCTVL